MERKALRGVMLFLAVAAVLGLALAAPALAAGGGSINFGIDAPMAKLGDAPFESVTYGGGFHNIAICQWETSVLVYAAFGSRNSSGENEICVAASDNGGQIWEPTELLALGPTIDITGPAIAIDPDCNKIHVAWGDGNSVFYSRGWPNWWSAPVNVGTGDGYTVSIAADVNGGVHIAFRGIGGILYSRSSDFGATFDEIAVPITNIGGQPSIAVDNLGNAYVAFTGNIYPDPEQVYFMKRDYITGVWSEPVAVEGSFPVASLPSIAVYDDSNIYIAWNRDNYDVYVAATSNGGATPQDWSQHPVETDPNWTGQYASLVVDANGVLNLAWDTGSLETIYFARSSDGGAKWTTPALAAQSLADFPNIAVDNAGIVHMIFTYKSSSYGRTTVQYTREQ